MIRRVLIVGAGIGIAALVAAQLAGQGEAAADEDEERDAGFLGNVRATIDGIQESVENVDDETAQRNVAAFLVTVRTGEGTADADGYRRLYGGGLFNSFSDHPRVAIKSPWGWTTAAGAYQAMARSLLPDGSGRYTKVDTWGDFVRAVGDRDFSPASQDEFAVWCIKRRGALADVKAGRFEVAVEKCAKEWASLPGAQYGQPTRTLDQARATYEQNGGIYA